MNLIDKILSFGFHVFMFCLTFFIIMFLISLPGIGLFFIFIKLYNNKYFISSFIILPFLVFYSLFLIRLLFNGFLNEKPYNEGLRMIHAVRKKLENSYNDLKNEIGN